MNYIKRCFKSPKNSYFLFGPRGTGKTTWLNQNCSDALAVNLLEPELYRRYHARPERLRELVEGNPHKNTVIVDEIQKVPEILDVVHFLIEEMPRLQFILTGSSARKIKQKGVDLLAGRAVVRSLHPFTASELKNHFQLKKALETGLIPLVTASQNPSDTLNAYIQLYLEEEVKMEGLVRNIGNFARFLEAVSFSHAQVLNVSNVARECEVERKTVQGFLEILYDLLMAYLVPVFTKKAKRAVIQHPKFFLFDTGVYRALRPSGPLDRPGEIEGPALEGLVAQHIRAWIDYSESQAKLYYWRTRGGSEVDFIIYGKEEFLAIEVKNTRNIRKNDLRSLRSFHNDYPECRPLMIYRGNETLRIDHILCIPCEAFLKSIKPNQPLLSFSK
jgi:predicted AAA+ superfamily ATPase